MKQAAAVAFAGSLAAVAYYQGSESTQLFEVDQVARSHFDSYVAEYGKSYGTKEEFNFRMSLFASMDAEIKEINASQDSFTVGHNHLSTWTAEEKAKRASRGLGKTMENQLDKNAFTAEVPKGVEK